MREQKLLEEKLEKQREKELKEQQRKNEREEKGTVDHFIKIFEVEIFDHAIWQMHFFRRTTKTRKRGA